MRWQRVMLAFVPISILAAVFHAAPAWVFVTTCLAIIPLAGMMGVATEELAKYRGQAIGGLLNATFGNATELIIAIVAVFNGEVEVVRASLIGSIVGNLLLVLGLSSFLGGLRYKEQTFSKDAAGTHSSMMTIAVISLLVPAIFVRNVPGLHERDVRVETLSFWVAAVLIALYVGGLVFSLRTHQSTFVQCDDDGDRTGAGSSDDEAEPSVLDTACQHRRNRGRERAVWYTASGPSCMQWHVSKLFLGIILIPIIGNAAEHSTAVYTAMKNKMDISLNIAVSSATQIAMFVGPVIIFVSALTAHRVTILFSNIEVITVRSAVVITGQVTRDGKSNWLEGAQLLAAYIIIALAFFFIPTRG